ncbi:methyl-accepting chemotaxis protein [Alicyclobacillus sp. SO9]|uniref:methyl-accepting chemotaxis protein n=1 Tax=Alicyclobacillus sp. SO9 TaxID=2665646 RepID=UPI0018E70A01|nr:methyl-accepting chemotaxis protein [Alicyclobacillus sp. SO9]QQE79870.1 methyl-accepting chemotaxis protein [Alicyclobacillus sp. SO9]
MSDRRLPARLVRAQSRIVEKAAAEIGEIIGTFDGLTADARAQIRGVMDKHLGELEYFVLVRRDSYGEIHTNHLREGRYFSDAVGVQCAKAEQTTAFYYPRDTGEQLIDVSTPIIVGKTSERAQTKAEVYVLRSGQILPSASRKTKFLLPLILLSFLAALSPFLPSRVLQLSALWIFLALSVVLIILYENSFQQSYKKWVQFMRNIGKGSLNGQLSARTRDELGQINFELNKMALGVKNIIHQVSTSASQVAAASEELSASVQETTATTQGIVNSIQVLAAGAESQAQSTRGSLAGSEDISGKTKYASEESESIAKASQETQKLAYKGRDTLRDATTHMNEMNTTLTNLSSVVGSLSQQTEKIQALVSTVGGISKQTNLLALNASIEAVNAGESGRGFAVVAEEVRKLAEQSRYATDDIQTSVEKIQTEMDSTVQLMNEATRDMTQEIELVSNSNHSFEQIVEAVSDISQQIAQISGVFSEVAQDSDSIRQSLGEINSIAVAASKSSQQMSAGTEEQLAAMEQISASSTELATMAEELRTIVNRFSLE